MAKSREGSQKGSWLADPRSLQTLRKARPYIKAHEQKEKLYALR